jgi:hypothetical protein
MRKLVVGIGCVAAIAAAGCGKHDEIPEKLRGSYKVNRFLLGTVTVVVDAKELRTPDCHVNCGVEKLPLTDIACTPAINPTKCTYKSEHCTGSIELDSGGNTVSITATPVPGATGDALGKRNMTCAQISGNYLERAK